MQQILWTFALALPVIGVSGTQLRAGCGDSDESEGQEIFRHDTFGTEDHWTNNLQMHNIISSAVSPNLALAVGLKVDAEAVPPAVFDAIGNDPALLDDPATTVALLKLDAVVGVKGEVDQNDNLVSVGITCALCHSTVDDSVPGFEGKIGKRQDGHPNRDLNAGAILALSSFFTDEQKNYLNSWGPGKFDPRYSVDGKTDGAVLIPPSYGLKHIPLETYTGDGPLGYWHEYVAVTQMGGKGSFKDLDLRTPLHPNGIDIQSSVELVKPKLAALVAYEHTLRPPAPDPSSFDARKAAAGKRLFRGQARCSTCHSGPNFTDVAADGSVLHDPAETGMDPKYALRSKTKKLRTTPLRGVSHHPPYFHDGSADTLADVVEHYDNALSLSLNSYQKEALVEYLKSL